MFRIDPLNYRRALGLVISCLGKAFDLLAVFNIFDAHEVNVSANDRLRLQRFETSEHNLILFSKDLRDVSRVAQSDPEALALADRVLVNAFMNSQNIAVFVNKFALLGNGLI